MYSGIILCLFVLCFESGVNDIGVSKFFVILDNLVILVDELWFIY